MRGRWRAVAVLLVLLALSSSAGATCPDFAAWLRPENEVRAARGLGGGERVCVGGGVAGCRRACAPPCPARLLRAN